MITIPPRVERVELLAHVAVVVTLVLGAIQAIQYLIEWLGIRGALEATLGLTIFAVGFTLGLRTERTAES